MKKIIEKMNCASIDVVKARDMLILFDKKVEIREAYLARMRVALGEIEDLNEETIKLLEKHFKAKTWVPIADKVDSDTAHPVPTYFDGLAFFTEKLRPILLGYK